MKIEVDFSKYADQLAPVVVQDVDTRVVLMVGFMNEEALEKTIKKKLVTFYSRGRKRLWTKGETSKNYLHLVALSVDCDNDTLLIKARPDGPVCHKGNDTCFAEKNSSPYFIPELEKIIENRISNPSDRSYVSGLFRKGINRIAQKVGEEAVELIIEAKDDNKEKFKEEAADLLFHFLLLLRAKECTFGEIASVLESRHQKAKE